MTKQVVLTEDEYYTIYNAIKHILWNLENIEDGYSKNECNRFGNRVLNVLEGKDYED